MIAGRGTLATRLFLVTGGLVAACVLLAVLVTLWRANQIARASAEDELTAARSAQASFQRQRVSQLRLIAQTLSRDPAFVAYVAEGDPMSIGDLLSERARDLGSDFAIVLDRNGRSLARSDRPGETGADLSRHPLVLQTATGGEAAGVWNDGAGLHDAVAVPLLSGFQVAEGTLIAGFAIDDRLAGEVSRLTGADVAYLSAADGGAMKVAASTVAIDAAQLDRATTAAREPLARALAGEATAPFDLSLGGHRYLATAAPMRDAAGAPVAVAMALVPLDGLLAPFRRLSLELALVALACLLAAFGLSWSLSRRIARPAESLAAAAERARHGDYDSPIAVEGDDEIARLSRSIDGLLSELREKRDLETYLRQLGASLPDAASAASESPAANAAGREDALAPGRVLGNRFEILSRIGAGGMGVVYRARDRELDEIVALKTLSPRVWGNADMLDRLKSELRLARRITHRHVVRTHDFGEIDGVPFITMEFVRGVNLATLLDASGPLPWAAGVRLARQMCAGLEAAHAVGVVHRDLKPANVVLEPTGDAKLMDFGIAQAVRRDGAPGAATGPVEGTLHYLPPEVLAGAAPDARADLYALGVVVYQMLTGRLPFEAMDMDELYYRQLNEEPLAPRAHRPELPARLDAVLTRALAREPGRRYPDAATLRIDLEELRA